MFASFLPSRHFSAVTGRDRLECVLNPDGVMRQDEDVHTPLTAASDASSHDLRPLTDEISLSPSDVAAAGLPSPSPIKAEYANVGDRIDAALSDNVPATTLESKDNDSDGGSGSADVDDGIADTLSSSTSSSSEDDDNAAVVEEAKVSVPPAASAAPTDVDEVAAKKIWRRMSSRRLSAVMVALTTDPTEAPPADVVDAAAAPATAGVCTDDDNTSTLTFGSPKSVASFLYTDTPCGGSRTDGDEDFEVQFTPGIVVFLKQHAAYMPPALANVHDGGNLSWLERLGPVHLLWGVFHHYASAGDPTHATTLTSLQFKKFARDAGVMAVPGLPKGDRRVMSGANVDLLFTKKALGGAGTATLKKTR